MKAVIYARYSSDNQREESIEGQIRECTAFAEKNDITILKHYIDRAFWIVFLATAMTALVTRPFLRRTMSRWSLPQRKFRKALKAS